MALRETGSILVQAPRERVFDVIQQKFLLEPGLRSVGARRFESDASTIVLQDAPGGATRVVVARAQAGLPTEARRDGLRSDVHGELLALQKLLE